MKNLSFLVVAPLILASCGDSTSSSGGSGTEIKSQFIDAPVKGLKFQTAVGEKEGETDSNGFFNCKAGEKVTFSVKDLEIGSANCGDKIYISEMTPATGIPTSDHAAMIIQSFSKNANGVLDLLDWDAFSTLTSPPI